MERISHLLFNLSLCATIWVECWKFSFCSRPYLTVKPIAVHITTREKYVSAEKRYDVECKSSGSRPEAVLTWWKGSRQIKRMAKNVRFIRICCLLSTQQHRVRRKKGTWKSLSISQPFTIVISSSFQFLFVSYYLQFKCSVCSHIFHDDEWWIIFGV